MVFAKGTVTVKNKLLHNSFEYTRKVILDLKSFQRSFVITVSGCLLPLMEHVHL